ncbi:MAG: response regulator, partial [Bacteroidia bacterium]|nr:response regulator [Bacteroidia bacterium]
NRYDVILMDYNMPYLDGIETVRNIREKLQLSANKLPIILLNNSTEDENLNKICDELAIQYKLIKPIKLNQLYDCLVQIQNKDNEVKAPLTEPKKQEINKDLVNILIADDNQINMMLTKSIFKNILPNAVIKEAQNGVEAVSMFVKHNPDIVFMDIQMPEMNGYKAATEIRKFEKDGRVPIVALTAGTVVGEKERCLRAGMDDYISKPVITETIINTINKWLEYSNGIYKKKENMETNETDKHFDFEKLKERLDQDVELISQLLEMTKEYLVDFLPILDDLIAKNDRAAIKSHAHKLKGTALSVCFNELAMLLLEFEKLDNYDDYNFISLRAKISTEAEYLIQMINEREG